MADDLKSQGPQDRSRVAKERLAELVKPHGNSVDKIRAALK